MPAKTPTINLLQREDLENSPIGRITTWAVTYGRYIMIGTEIIVLLAFISRFSLDRKLTDLKEEISQKQAILQANQDFERDFKQLQTRLTQVKGLLNNQSKPIDMISMLQTLLPPDVYLETLDYSAERMVISATAGSTTGFSQFLANLQSTKQITLIEVGDIKKQPLVGIQFRLTAFIAPVKKS